MVLLVQGEQTGVRDLRVLSDADLFLSFKQKERLEGWRRVHLCYRSGSDAANDRKLFLRNKMTISAVCSSKYPFIQILEECSTLVSTKKIGYCRDCVTLMELVLKLHSVEEEESTEETVETRRIKTPLDGRLLNGQSHGVVWKTVPRLCGVFFF